MMMASVAALEAVAPPARNPHKTRKRAPKACLSCRARKVRCDVSQRGRPCMNCYLDSEACIVTSRASRLRKGENEGAEVSHPPFHIDEFRHEDVAGDTANLGVNGESASPQPEAVELVNDSHTTENVHAAHVACFAENIQAGIQLEQQPYPGFTEHHEPSFNRPLNAVPTFNNAPSIPLQGFDSLANLGVPFWAGEHPAAVNADITYSYYPFLAINNLHNVIPQDVNFLESQGCLRIPTRAILDEFVQQYFLHVHPLLPFLNEGDFWNLYCNQGCPGEKMSLLVFQAMLFSCCNFVSKTSIKALGFPNIRAARATLYRRTKLLFDFDTESSLVCVAQAALLLTYWAPNWSLAAKKPNTAWLGVAIQNAKSAEAHIYSAMPTFSPVTEPIEYKKQNSLKRLWWCCVFRDRLISLGMRRSIQVSRAHFDVDSNRSLGFSDLANEVGLSKVYNSETKRRLIEIFVQLGELCSVLTDLLTLVFPLDDVPGWGRHNGAEGAEKVRQSKAALKRWYNAATLRFPVFGGSGGSGKTTGEKHLQHDSVILYTNLMYMFYHSARAALCHHEVLQAAMASASPNLNSNIRGFSNVYESRYELQDAACGVTECLNELIQRRLARWLPISAISCTAMPLVLHIIDVKLSSQHKRSGMTPEERRRTAQKQQRLNVLIEAMKTYQPQYDGVDYISETIRHIVNLAQIDPPNNSSSITSLPQDSMQPIISDWTDILASNPGSYLRLSMTMDISISKGRLAKETDFPVKLRGLFAHGLSPIRALLAGGQAGASPAFGTTGTAPQPSVAPGLAPHIQVGSVHSVSSDEDSASPDSAADGSAGTLVDNEVAHNEVAQTEPSGPELAIEIDMHEHDHEHHDIFADIDYALNDSSGNNNMNNSDGNGTSADTGTGTSIDSGAPTEDCEMYDGEGDAAREADWIGRAWDDEGLRGDGEDGAAVDAGDKETARVLLDALRDDTILCAV